MNFFGSGGNQMKRKALNLKSVKSEIGTVQHTFKKYKYDETKPVVAKTVGKKRENNRLLTKKSLTMFLKK